MEFDQRLADYLQEAEARIDWVLAHPHTSDWLRTALDGARRRNPVELLNDLEMLDHLLRSRARAQIEAALPVPADRPNA
ncbi:hypothetical protein EDC22_104359 [Tepidamorphus gemmatus]|jgi:hypothetical protein|uniref:Uncharacterized protein n=1 Tax=Tepidamorphus gemmatus TaxID=747076 RepID=A0A4R3MDS2_9HYPH|nr:hypothetical protein [Tepidamorphus gemmatus]TCT11596.1 hypothetical protein EDC22_104359 [Tepidamorphus gemmatus]